MKSKNSLKIENAAGLPVSGHKLIVLCLVLALLLPGCKKNPKDPEVLTDVVLSGKTITLQPKDELKADSCNELDVTYNEKTYKKYPILYKGITIGSKRDDMMQAFDIKEGYAIIDREIDTVGDGTTDIVREEYKNQDFFDKEEVLDANFIFGYEQKEGQWMPIAYKELEAISKNPEKASNVLFYQIDIRGSADPEYKSDWNKVIRFSISYYE